MNNIMNGIFFVFLGIVALFTGEIVTFIMLGFILVSLQNINHNIKKSSNESVITEHYIEKDE